MSAKQLSKSAWESQAKRLKVDDKALGKALAAFEKCREDDHDAQLEALTEVEKTAEGLRKDKKFAEASDYLREVIDAAKQERKAVAKAAEEDESEEGADEETAEYLKDLPKQLKSALNRVKSLAPGDPPPPPGEGPEQLKFMAYVAGANCAVIVAKKVGGAAKKLVAKISGATGGKYIKGECIFEKNAHTFVMDQVPGGIKAHLSAALLKETGQKFKVRVRSTDGQEEEGAEGESEESATVETTTTTPGMSATEILTRLKALKPDLDQVLAAAVASSAAAKTHFLATATLSKEQKLEAAAASLAELEKAIEKGLAEIAGPSAPPPPTVDLEAAFKTRLTGLMPKIKEAIAAGTPAGQSIRLKTTEAGAFAKQKDFAKASGVLSEIEILLGAPSPATGTEAPGGGMAAFTARLKTLMPELAKAIAAGSPTGLEGKGKVAAAGTAAKAGNLQEANRLLDEVAAALAGPQPQAPVSEEGTKPAESTEGDWLSALATLEPDYLKVMTGVPEEGVRMRSLMMQAQDQADGGDFAKAIATLGQLEEWIKKGGASETGGIPPGLVNYRAALVGFAQAKSQVAAQIATLKSTIPGIVPEEKALADAVADYLGGWNDLLGDTIDAAINMAKDDRAPCDEATKKVIRDYLTDLDSNKMFEHADSNPLSPVDIRGTLGGALRRIELTMAKL